MTPKLNFKAVAVLLYSFHVKELNRNRCIFLILFKKIKNRELNLFFLTYMLFLSGNMIFFKLFFSLIFSLK